MIEFISQPWPWYVSGPMIALVMFMLLMAGGQFGVSSTLRSFCAIGGAGKRVSFFDFDWKRERWNLVFIAGAVIGGFIASTWLAGNAPLQLSAQTVADLQDLGFEFRGGLVPEEYVSWSSLFTFRGWMLMVVGGFFVGFGARWAGGCTSGHAISGLSNLQLPSLIAVIGFFIGGLVMTHLIYPLIF